MTARPNNSSPWFFIGVPKRDHSTSLFLFLCLLRDQSLSPSGSPGETILVGRSLPNRRLWFRKSNTIRKFRDSTYEGFHRFIPKKSERLYWDNSSEIFEKCIILCR